ncbi:MAG TPA: hypothetical protein DD001_22445 [Microcoleaceae bacterium UBA10368]|nr:hypothetical protein [Microcoleaceae cyanobacterium UBA10368]HCV30021.1 hypothetical protein [Microcoleaceae cyanobacterium UBA9251]
MQEVWFWEDGLFTLYNLGAEGYDRINRSELVPELDFELLTRCVLMNSIGDAALEFDPATSASLTRDRAKLKLRGDSQRE